jgi:hypothetical protein
MKHKVKKIRNLLHNHPLMSKGGVHEKAKKAKRKAEKQIMRREWGCLMALRSVLLNNYTPFRFAR